MAGALNPSEIFQRAAKEGRRRLAQSLVELTATGFIAGFTIVFGMIAMGIIEGLARDSVGEFAKVLGALGFGLGIVFLIVGRAELFSENFFDPVAAAFEPHQSNLPMRIARLWGVTLVLNLVGGTILVLLMSVEGALPGPAHDALASVGLEVAAREALPALARAILGGALVALLSFLAIASNSGPGRIMLAYSVGVLLALGPFDHVVVSVLHLMFGIALGAPITVAHFVEVSAIALAGNLLGGVGLVTLSHAAQARAGNDQSEGRET